MNDHLRRLVGLTLQGDITQDDLRSALAYDPNTGRYGGHAIGLRHILRYRHDKGRGGMLPQTVPQPAGHGVLLAQFQVALAQRLDRFGDVIRILLLHLVQCIDGLPVVAAYVFNLPQHERGANAVPVAPQHLLQQLARRLHLPGLLLLGREFTAKMG